MRRFEISNSTTSVTLGTYSGETEAEALDAMAQDVGYADYEAMREVLGQTGESDLLVTDIEVLPVMVGGLSVARNAVVALMDDEIRESLHDQAWESEQEFVDAYCEAHEAKYGQAFVVS
jgi:hypothetical protein